MINYSYINWFVGLKIKCFAHFKAFGLNQQTRIAGTAFNVTDNIQDGFVQSIDIKNKPEW